MCIGNTPQKRINYLKTAYSSLFLLDKKSLTELNFTINKQSLNLITSCVQWSLFYLQVQCSSTVEFCSCHQSSNSISGGCCELKFTSCEDLIVSKPKQYSSCHQCSALKRLSTSCRDLKPEDQPVVDLSK